MQLADITKDDPALVVAFQKFTTRVHAAENFSFWFDNGNNQGKYAKYIKPGAPKELTLDNHQLVDAFKEQAAAEDWGAMDGLFDRARTEVSGMLAGRMREFEQSREYDEYVLVKKAGNIKKALKLLGVTGSSATALEKLMKEYAVGNTSEKAAALVKMKKLAKADVLERTLKSSGLM